jgi:lipoprotein-anchoring transpeptidase ErfK/SrfK
MRKYATVLLAFLASISLSNSVMAQPQTTQEFERQTVDDIIKDEPPNIIQRVFPDNTPMEVQPGMPEEIKPEILLPKELPKEIPIKRIDVTRRTGGVSTVKLIEDGKVIKTFPAISGRRGNQTPTGPYYIDRNDHGRLKMRAPLINGEREYEVEVSYKIHIVNGIYFHDASWRSASEYRRGPGNGGSHGCLNTPPEAIKFLHKWVGNPNSKGPIPVDERIQVDIHN